MTTNEDMIRVLRDLTSTIEAMGRDIQSQNEKIGELEQTIARLNNSMSTSMKTDNENTVSNANEPEALELPKSFI